MLRHSLRNDLLFLYLSCSKSVSLSNGVNCVTLLKRLSLRGHFHIFYRSNLGFSHYEIATLFCAKQVSLLQKARFKASPVLLFSRLTMMGSLSIYILSLFNHNRRLNLLLPSLMQLGFLLLSLILVLQERDVLSYQQYD